MNGPSPLDSTRAEGRSFLWDRDLLARSPLFWPLAHAGDWLEACESFPSPESIDDALAGRAGVRFERQTPVPRRRRVARDPASMYDARIAAGAVPTRPGSWHDLMNALVWATFPHAKRTLHAKQHALVVPGAPMRSREQDALALVDEGAVVVAMRAPADGEDALAAAVASGEGKAIVFGHAIYEGIVLGRPLPLASALVVAVDPASDALLRAVDAAVAERLASLREPRDLLRLRL